MCGWVNCRTDRGFADAPRFDQAKEPCPGARPQYITGMTEGISIDPAVCHGKPVIKGTRVLVPTILGALAGGDSRDMIVEDYEVTMEQISAALASRKHEAR